MQLSLRSVGTKGTYLPTYLVLLKSFWISLSLFLAFFRFFPPGEEAPGLLWGWGRARGGRAGSAGREERNKEDREEA